MNHFLELEGRAGLTDVQSHGPSLGGGKARVDHCTNSHLGPLGVILTCDDHPDYLEEDPMVGRQVVGHLLTMYFLLM